MKYITEITIRILYIFILFLCLPLSARTDLIEYDNIASSIFWDELYTYGGWTLYCGYRFESDKKIGESRSVTIEHIYPTDLMIEQLGCNSRMQCRESGNKKFTRMEADMHNMYPVWQALVTHRYRREYGIIEGEEWRFSDCDIEWQGNVLEPRPLARGNIARALLYMYKQYNLYLDPGIIILLGEWNRADPPSNQEIERNNRIEALQGVRNQFIDNPSKVDQIVKSIKKK